MALTKFRKAIMTLAAATAMNALNAMPAYPGLITALQPDGTEIQIRLMGDENFHWAETPEGFTLLRDSENFWTYALPDANGQNVASSYRYDGVTAIPGQVAASPHLQPARPEQTSSAPKKVIDKTLQINTTFPATGKRKLLMLLLNYRDTEPVVSQELFSRAMNEEGFNGIGSFRDFYLQQSYGKLDIEVTVMPWYTLGYAKTYYGENGAKTMIIEALNQLNSEIDFRDFDNDGDGVLDGLAVIHQGFGQEMSASSDDIWSHSDELTGITLDGVAIRRYTIEPELLSTGGMSTIGVVCHEFGHNLGAPDFYDTDYEYNGGYFPGTGTFDLMGSGGWNGNYGDRPAGFNMWEKIQLGWVEPETLTETTSVADMPPAHKQPVAYKMNTTVPGEYFILENRQQDGPFDCAIPASGLIIYHVNEKLVRETVHENTLNVQYPQACYTVCAGAGIDPNKYVSSYGKVNSDMTPFPGAYNVTRFDDYSLPSTKSISGRSSYIAIDNIRRAGENMSFDFISLEAPAHPVNLLAESQQGILKLTWELSDPEATPEYYTVYANDEEVATVTQPLYIDHDPISGVAIEYSVDATYADGKTSPYTSTIIRVPDNKACNISYSIQDRDVVLRWEVDKKLTRTNLATDALFTTASFNTSSVTYAHRFTAADCAVLKGCKIVSVSILPMNPPSVEEYTVKVWETDKNGQKPKLMSEKDVTEFTTSIWRNVPLDKQVTIISGRDYYIGAECRSKQGWVDLLTDQGPTLSGYGDLVLNADGEWEISTRSSGNFYLSAEMTFSTHSASTSVQNYPDVTNPAVELIYPIGFCIYRDNELIGTTGNRVFIDKDAPEGYHRYTISSLYRGNNESKTDMIMVDNGESGLHAENAVPFAISAVGGGIEVTGNGSLRVTTATGVTVCNTTISGNRYVALHPGLYLVTLNNETCKFLVR